VTTAAATAAVLRRRQRVRSSGAASGASLLTLATLASGLLTYAFLVLAVLGLLTAPLQNVVSRRYEAEADWRALRATRDPASATKLFQSFETTSLEQPNPSSWDYLWLENHPTLMQRIAMAQAWRTRDGSRPSR